MKVALVHDYLSEFGGAERVLLALSEIWPSAPIFTAFFRKGSAAWERFKEREIITSWVQNVPLFKEKLYSPLRFLAPQIWGSLAKKLKDYDVVITSSSWYITKGLHKNEICYCHTPPRWLYGYATATNWQQNKLIKTYGLVVGHFMRHYDFLQAQKVKQFVANSQETKRRISKFYRRDSVVIYPPVELPKALKTKKQNYYLIVSRLVGSKGIEMGIEAAKKLNIKLKIVGEGPLKIQPQKNIEVLGQVSDDELVKLYSEAKGFLALAKDEDFGITPVEAMGCGTGVIGYKGGGYLESVIEGKTGVLFEDYSVESLMGAIKKFDDLNLQTKDCIEQAKKFSKERFKREIKSMLE
ncbi:MAG: glycosyltransferase [Candidatus Beckwithbacteria bacterium]